MNGNALELGNACVQVTGTPLGLWKDWVSSWGSADPAVGVEVSRWLPSDHCILLDSCTKKSSVCPHQYWDRDSISLVHGLLSSPWLLFAGEAADAVVCAFLNNCSVTPWECCSASGLPSKRILRSSQSVMDQSVKITNLFSWVWKGCCCVAASQTHYQKVGDVG